ncbi:MAG: TolC family protein [Burkholderiales bacterium]
MSVKQMTPSRKFLLRFSQLVSVENLRYGVVAISLCLIWPASAKAWSMADPLQVVPDVIHTGVILPGDDGIVPCPAHKDFTQPLSLGDAVDLALCNNPQIQAAWAAIKIEAGAVGEAQAAYLPTVSGTVSPMSTRSSYPGTTIQTSTINGNAASATLSWRLFDFGGRAANLETAKKLLTAAIASDDAALQKSLATVIQIYFDVMTTKAALAAGIDTTRIAQQTLNETRKREAKGVAPLSDTLQATAALARASLQQQRADGDYRKDLALLVQALGVPTHTQIHISDTMDELQSDSVKELDTWLTEAELRHPAIRAARAQLEAAKNKVTATRSDGLPTVDFSANYYKNAYPGQGLQTIQTNVTDVGLTLTVPLFDGFSRNYKIRGAEAQVEQQEAQLMDTEHQILTEVVKAYADSVSSLNNLQYSQTLLDAEQSVLASSQRRYDKGEADILELLNAEASLADAQRERIRCLADWHSARLRLMANTGVLDRSLIGH